MSRYQLPQSLEELAEYLGLLPGIGPKMARRLAIHLAIDGKFQADKLGNILQSLSSRVQECTLCSNVTDADICSVCSDKARNQHSLMIVESSLDLLQIEQFGVYNGLYFVLGNLISPAAGILIDDLPWDKLITRLKDLNTTEVILALTANVEGEATSMYIKQLLGRELKSETIQVSRLAKGLPTGVNIEYLDSETLKGALDGRVDL